MRLIGLLVPPLAEAVTRTDEVHRSLRGLLADLGTPPLAKVLDDVRHEMSATLLQLRTSPIRLLSPEPSIWVYLLSSHIARYSRRDLRQSSDTAHEAEEGANQLRVEGLSASLTCLGRLSYTSLCFDLLLLR